MQNGRICVIFCGMLGLPALDSVVCQAIHQLKGKYLGCLAVTPSGLLLLLNGHHATKPIPIELLALIPFYRKRLKEIGYNQSGLLARGLGKIVKLAVMDGALMQKQYTLLRTKTATENEGPGNVQYAFTRSDGKLVRRSVLLIDDVSNLSSTLQICSVR